jgi:2-C-methyl-D-erythritol 4-phosphate cytidylyltransferase
MPLADTLKRSEGTLRVAETIPRDGLWRAQTPQMFRYATLRRGLARSPRATDESQAVEAIGQMPRLVQGVNTNFKVTFTDDLPIAEMILARRHSDEETSS